jgi:glycosyltransferase involved in cell wall biosynthesis
MEAPLVSVVIPVLNGERTIRECLASVLHGNYPADRREILVVDNGSTDRTVEVVASHPVQLLHEPRRGAAAARNRGIAASQGAILAFTDADCIATTSWLRELVAGFTDPAVAAVEGEVSPYPSAGPVERYAAMIGSHTRESRVNNPLAPFVNTANVAFRREVFQRIGCFDTHFPAAGFEDVDFSWRFFRESDLTLSDNRKAIVFHRARSTTRDFFCQHLRYGRGLAVLQAKYPARLPWTWRDELRAWCAAAGLGWRAATTALRQGLQGGATTDTLDLYYGFLRKLAVRQGFLWGILMRER